MRRGCAWLVFSLLASGGAAWGDPFLKGPYLQHSTQTSVVIMWQSDPAAAGTITVAGRTIAAPVAGVHEITVDGLKPGQRYAYTVVCGGEKQGGELVTAPDPSEPFSFVVFGDTRSNSEQHRLVVERVRREVPDFILVTGDFVDDGAKEEDWQTFFKIEKELLRDNVLFPAVGNHDRQGRARTADAYRRYFSVPDDAPDPERYYALTYANTRLFILDSNEYSFALTDQTAWLEKELAKAAADPALQHRFVVMHHPPFSTSLHGGQPELRDMWTPLFERYGVDAVFSGHDHAYERAERNGVRYFVSGGGGAPLYPRVPKPHTEDGDAEIYFERTLHYVRVQVVGAFVEVAAIREDGTLIESLSWGALPQHLVASAPVVAAAPPQEASAVPLPSTRGGSSSSGGCSTAPGAAGAPATLLLVSVPAAFAARRRARRRRSGAARSPSSRAR